MTGKTTGGSTPTGSKQVEPELVYFVQELPFGPVKIGKTVNLKSRLSQLQNGNPRELVLAGHLIGREGLEKEIHKEFKDLQIEREWYRPEPGLIRFVTENEARYLEEAEHEYWQMHPKLNGVIVFLVKGEDGTISPKPVVFPDGREY